jgi:hypothetical protein
MLDTAECEADKVELLARDAELPKWEADEEEWADETELLAREADEELCALEDELTCKTDTEDECAEEDVTCEAELLECTADEELAREVDADDAELLARKAELLGCAVDDELCAPGDELAREVNVGSKKRPRAVCARTELLDHEAEEDNDERETDAEEARVLRTKLLALELKRPMRGASR